MVVEVGGEIDADRPGAADRPASVMVRNRRVCCDLSYGEVCGAAGLSTILAVVRYANDVGCTCTVVGCTR